MWRAGRAHGDIVPFRVFCAIKAVYCAFLFLFLRVFCLRTCMYMYLATKSLMWLVAIVPCQLNNKLLDLHVHCCSVSSQDNAVTMATNIVLCLVFHFSPSLSSLSDCPSSTLPSEKCLHSEHGYWSYVC